MRENRTCGSEEGEALRLPYPYKCPDADMNVVALITAKSLKGLGQ